MPRPIDLRSDTVTRPTPAMREAMAGAEVGDDVFGDDPTINLLQERVAALTGKEAALFVVSGTMGNQLALRSQVSHGDEILVEHESHIFLYESGAPAALSGAHVHLLQSALGVLDPAQVVAAVRPPDDHNAPLRLLCLENTHNRAGGTIVPLERLTALAETAHAHGLRVHLDGARLWNASVATGIPIARWAEPVDTVMMCFSKGLGAPVGSILAGPQETIRRARRFRKMYGGGVRQGGVLAAACLHALDHHVDRLADDHRRARRLGELAAGVSGLGVDPSRVETNILFIELEGTEWTAPAAVEALRERNVWLSAYGPSTLRAVTHLDVNDEEIERAGGILAEVLSASDRRPAATR
jgi:threonine aldolase